MQMLSEPTLARRHVLLLTLVYVVAHGLLLADPGVYWDDWYIFRQPVHIMRLNYTNNGMPLLWQMVKPVVSLPGQGANYAANILTFLFHLGVGLLLYGMARRSRYLKPNEAFVLALIALVFPINLARAALINYPYALCLFLFYLAATLVQIDLLAERRAWWRVVIAAGLFWMSFETNSILVYYFLVPAYAVFVRKPRSLVALVRAGIAASGWVVLPLAYWAVRKYVILPNAPNLQMNYNAVQPSALLHMPVDMVKTFYYSFIKPLLLGTLTLRPDVVTGLVLVGLLLVVPFWRPLRAALEAHVPRPTWPGLLLGAALFAIAAFPYLAVNKMPTMAEFSSRHQLLMGPGIALLIYFGIATVAHFTGQRNQARVQMGLLTAVLLVCITYDVRTYVLYERDWIKQRSLLAQIATDPGVRDNKTFVVIDNTRQYNVFERLYRYYEFTGMFRTTLHQHTRLAAWPEEWTQILHPKPNSGYFFPLDSLHANDQWQMTPPNQQMVISAGENLSDADVLRETFFGTVPDERIERFVHLQTLPYNGTL